MTQNLEVMANKEAMMMSNSRDKALELVEEGLVSADDMLIMALKYMSTDDVEDMLDCNELSDRFIEEKKMKMKILRTMKICLEMLI